MLGELLLNSGLRCVCWCVMTVAAGVHRSAPLTMQGDLRGAWLALT